MSFDEEGRKSEDASAPTNTAPKNSYTDGRKPWDWESKYPVKARSEVRFEALFLIGSLIVCTALAGFSISLGDQVIVKKVQDEPDPVLMYINAKLFSLFFTGCVGGITFSIKWLVHAVATGKWHQDRRYWRLLIPWLGGVYALAVLMLASGGYLGAPSTGTAGIVAASPALAFLVGYFSDGVSGLLSNIANAVFGTLEKK